MNVFNYEFKSSKIHHLEQTTKIKKIISYLLLIKKKYTFAPQNFRRKLWQKKPREQKKTFKLLRRH